MRMRALAHAASPGARVHMDNLPIKGRPFGPDRLELFDSSVIWSNIQQILSDLNTMIK